MTRIDLKEDKNIKMSFPAFVGFLLLILAVFAPGNGSRRNEPKPVATPLAISLATGLLCLNFMLGSIFIFSSAVVNIACAVITGIACLLALIIAHDNYQRS